MSDGMGVQGVEWEQWGVREEKGEGDKLEGLGWGLVVKLLQVFDFGSEIREVELGVVDILIFWCMGLWGRGGQEVVQVWLGFMRRVEGVVQQSSREMVGELRRYYKFCLKVFCDFVGLWV